MIWESGYWKAPLLSAAKWLRAIRLSERTRESTYVRIEKEIFFGFYSIRKLLDTLKVSDSTKVTTYELTWFPNMKPVDDLNWHQLDKCYDLSTEHTEIRDIQYLCNQFIHSYVFIMSGEFRIDGIYVASDRVRNKKVYFVPLCHILHAFRLIGRDYPSTFVHVKDPETGERRGRAL